MLGRMPASPGIAASMASSSRTTAAGNSMEQSRPCVSCQPLRMPLERRSPVMMDGGIRQGSDVPKAIALGAPFVFVRRPFVYAAAIRGEADASHATNILLKEISRNMGSFRINSLRELNPDRLCRFSGVEGVRTCEAFAKC